MTGRDLIVYILANGLENEPVVKDGTFIGFISIGEAAIRMNVGLATIYAWIIQERIDYVRIGDTFYIPANFKSPLEGR